MTRVILDEGVPRVLAKILKKHGVDATAFPNGLKQLSNGRLLDEIEKRGFDLLLTNDKSMHFQQSLKDRTLTVVSLPTNLRPVLLRMITEIVDAIRQAEPGRFSQMPNSGGHKN